MDNGRLMINNLQVHHIIPISVDDSLKLDNDNLITLCPRCHHEVEGHSEYVKVLKNLATSEVELK
jgi:5-methylcytosine-specific restriction endonuclease McrA